MTGIAKKKIIIQILVLVFANILNLSEIRADDKGIGKAAQKKPGFSLQAAEQVQLCHDNFLNKKIEVTGSAKYDDAEKKIRIGLLKKDFLSTHFFTGVDLSGKLEKDERYHLKDIGTDIYGGRMLTEKIKLTLKFEAQDVTMYRIASDAPQILKDSAGNSHVNNLGLILERISINDKYYPTKGTQNKIEWDYSVKGIGSDYNFNRITWQSCKYYTPGSFFTFAFRTKLGWEEDFGNTNDVPYFERFFVGGSGTVRGYKGKHVGPKDSQDLPLGGDFSWVNNFEMRFPLYKQLKGDYFFDAGGLWSKFDEFNLNDIKCGTGLGLRYITPWGVARIDYGIRISHDKSEPSSRLHLSFGVPF